MCYLKMLENHEVLDGVGLLDGLEMLDNRNVLDGDNVLGVACHSDPLFPHGPADLLGMELLELYKAHLAAYTKAYKIDLGCTAFFFF